MSRTQLDELRPLNPQDPDFPLAVQAMRNALATSSIQGRHPDRFWMVDLSGEEPVDMVTVVDLTSVGNVAIGTASEWHERSKCIRVHRLGDEYAVRDVVESLTNEIRKRRVRAETEVDAAPGPRP